MPFVKRDEDHTFVLSNHTSFVVVFEYKSRGGCLSCIYNARYVILLLYIVLIMFLVYKHSFIWSLFISTSALFGDVKWVSAHFSVIQCIYSTYSYIFTELQEIHINQLCILVYCVCNQHNKGHVIDTLRQKI